ncbi:MAG: immunoglobulin kappa light chain variable domain-containing protein [Oscillospiraceae bacterium]|nr:immunoglobulin kappa light chain variable domain-containing protein [Oscillospiraceae bacterium]
MKLFNKHMEPRCEYCRHGEAISEGESIVCLHVGISSPSDSCRRFVYDPTRRRPEPPARFTPGSYSEEDFTL